MSKKKKDFLSSSSKSKFTAADKKKTVVTSPTNYLKPSDFKNEPIENFLAFEESLSKLAIKLTHKSWADIVDEEDEKSLLITKTQLQNLIAEKK